LAELRQIAEIGLRRANGETVPEFGGPPAAAPPPRVEPEPATPTVSDRPRWSDLPEGTRRALLEAHTPEELADFFEDYTP